MAVTKNGLDTNNISDGFHTFGELYQHRFWLWINLASFYQDYTDAFVWRSEYHSDGSKYEGWFVLGMGDESANAGTQITYHLPMELWDRCAFAETLDRCPAFDGHTYLDVIERLKSL